MQLSPPNDDKKLLAILLLAQHAGVIVKLSVRREGAKFAELATGK